MSPQKNDPLQELTEEEQHWLERISQSYSEPAAHVTRAKEILGVAEKAGRKPLAKYQAREWERLITEFRRQPDPEKDGTNIWSLTTLQRALRKAEDGLKKINTEQIWVILQEAGYRWQKSRSWCETGQVARKRKRGIKFSTDCHTLQTARKILTSDGQFDCVRYQSFDC